MAYEARHAYILQVHLVFPDLDPGNLLVFFFSKLATKLKLQYQTNMGFRSKSIISRECEYGEALLVYDKA